MGPDAPPAAADGEDETIVTVGTSETTVGGLSGVALVCRLCAMVNRAYGYSRLSEHEVEGRLEMGDAGRAANRVLHIASRGGQVVGVCSSTLQAPWTPMGCGHWGLLVVDVDAQGSGVASALVRAAEQRLRAAGRSRVQIEYEYHGDRFSERLYRWCAPPRPRARAPRLSSGRPAPPPPPRYEGSCGFHCPSGPPGGRQQFRRCRKSLAEPAQGGARVDGPGGEPEAETLAAEHSLAGAGMWLVTAATWVWPTAVRCCKRLRRGAARRLVPPAPTATTTGTASCS